jgi:hypothetical protein
VESKDFFLCRLKVLLSGQRKLIEKGIPIPQKRGELLREMIRKRPSGVRKDGACWIIGNEKDIDNRTVYFRIGKCATKQVPKLEDGDFVDSEGVVSEYCHVFLDWEREFCGITHNSRLGSEQTILSALVFLLNKADLPTEFEMRVEGAIIRDPKPFLEALEKAVLVSSFSMEFSKRNLVDESEIREVLGEFAEELDGEENAVTFKNNRKGLKKGELSRTARATIVAGNKVAMKARMPGERKLRRFSTEKERAVKVAVSVADIEGKPEDVVEVLRGAFGNVLVEKGDAE